MFRKEIWDRCDASLDAEYWQYMLSNTEKSIDIGTFMRLVRFKINAWLEG